MDEGPVRFLISNRFARISRKKAKLYLPSTLTLFRLTLLPIVIFLMDTGQIVFADFLFLLAISSDLVDGYLARKMSVSSKFGANFDVSIDFFFISGMFLYFTIRTIYPGWVLMAIVAMFIQFLATSNLTKIIFDPIGKYYGSLLYGAIGLTMLFSEQTVRGIIMVAFVGVTVVSILSRLIYFLKVRQ